MKICKMWVYNSNVAKIIKSVYSMETNKGMLIVPVEHQLMASTEHNLKSNMHVHTLSWFISLFSDI